MFDASTAWMVVGAVLLVGTIAWMVVAGRPEDSMKQPRGGSPANFGS